ncbi:MAG TPA: YihY/virulence factor BrkB family protein [Gemmatimonadales bacterium]|nr:YihY/virulence factor BrkB family protein [Gemmatimonadales bacterium]
MLQAADESSIPFLASGVTFDALLAAVPFILLLVVGLTQVLQAVAGSGPDPRAVFEAFLPPHSGSAGDPFKLAVDLLSGVARNTKTITLVAIPTFIWFSTRLFAGVRTALNHIFDVGLRPRPRRNFLVAWASGKLRDVTMVVFTLTLFLLNAALTAGIALLQARGFSNSPVLQFFLTAGGRIFSEVVTVAFSVSLFFVLYRFSSTRKMPWTSALLAACFTAIMFELAKRLYALYLANFATARAAAGNADIGALLLFVLWVYYTALVFLLGGVVAETWELRRMQHRQRAVME